VRCPRVGSRNLAIRPASAPALVSAVAPCGRAGASRVPTTRTCLSSVVTDGAPVNQPSGSLPANQPAISSSFGFSMLTTLHSRDEVETSGSSRRPNSAEDGCQDLVEGGQGLVEGRQLRHESPEPGLPLPPVGIEHPIVAKVGGARELDPTGLGLHLQRPPQGR